MREYLTIEELKRLASTECLYPEVGRAFLFSCLTGLRRSDIVKLTWGEVSTLAGRTRLIYRQKKTRSQEYLDITAQAAELLGERGMRVRTILCLIRSIIHSGQSIFCGDGLPWPDRQEYHFPFRTTYIRGDDADVGDRHLYRKQASRAPFAPNDPDLCEDRGREEAGGG